MTPEIAEMEAELRKLVDMRERSVGIELKRINYQIATLQNKMDRTREER